MLAASAFSATSAAPGTGEESSSAAMRALSSVNGTSNPIEPADHTSRQDVEHGSNATGTLFSRATA
jgi:hypothetical protein